MNNTCIYNIRNIDMQSREQSRGQSRAESLDKKKLIRLNNQ